MVTRGRFSGVFKSEAVNLVKDHGVSVVHAAPKSSLDCGTQR